MKNGGHCVYVCTAEKKGVIGCEICGKKGIIAEADDIGVSPGGGGGGQYVKQTTEMLTKIRAFQYFYMIG